MSSFGRPAAAVRMMSPPAKPVCSRNSRTIPRRRERSSRDSIFRDTPTWSTVGMNTRKRPGHRGVRRQAGALGAKRFLGHLDDDFLSLFEELLDLRLGALLAIAIAPSALCRQADSRRWPPALAIRRWSAVAAVSLPADCPPTSRIVLFGLEAIELLEGRDDVGYVEEAVTFEPKIDEGRLHARQHLRDPALVDVANNSTRAFALDEDLRDLVVLEYRDPCFVGARGDDHLLAHARSSKRAAATRAESDRRRCAPRQAREQDRKQCSDHNPISVGRVLLLQTRRVSALATTRRVPETRTRPTRSQLVNRRIRTLRMRPNPASVAIMEEPP